jgi:beta-lactamase class A
MKLAVAIAAYREAEAGRLDLNRAVLVHNRFSSVVGPAPFGLDERDDSDPQPWGRLGQPVALRWLAYRALVRSSNLATNLLLEAVGLTAVATTLAVVGARDSVVVRPLDDVAAREAGLENLVTAADLARTLQALANRTAAGSSACDEIIAVLRAQQINDAIPAGLPAGTGVAHKSGWVVGVSHDAGIVYPADGPAFVLAVCTSSGFDGQPPLDAQAGLDLIAAGARAAWADRPGSTQLAAEVEP